MWNTFLGINSFIVIPVTSMFLIYALGRALIIWEWKLFVIALVFFCLALVAEVILGIMSD